MPGLLQHLFDGLMVKKFFPPVSTSKQIKKYAEDPSRKPDSKWVSYRAKIRRSFGKDKEIFVWFHRK